MKDKDNGVIFLKDWLLLIESLSDENKLVFWDLFTSYEFGKDQVCENLFVAPTWNFVKKQLDNMRSKYQENIVDRNKINGAKGGRPRKDSNQTQSNPIKPNQTEIKQKNPLGFLETEKTPNENVNENENKKDNENDILLKKESKEENYLKENLFENLLENELVKPAVYPSKKVAQKKVSTPKEKFKPPSVQQVQDYCNERSNGISAYSFVNFYQSKGWKVGNQPMKDWKAAIRTWEQKNKENGNNNTSNNGFNNNKGNSGGSIKTSGKVSARTLLARRISGNSTGDSESGNTTIDIEAIE